MSKRSPSFYVGLGLLLISLSLPVSVSAASSWVPNGDAVLRFIQRKTVAVADAPNIVEPRPVNHFLALQLKGIREVNDACTGYAHYAAIPEPPQYDLARSSAFAGAALLALQSIDLSRKYTDSALSLNDRHRQHTAPADIKAGFQLLEQNFYAYQQRLAWTQQLLGQGVLTTAQVHERMDSAFIQLATPQGIDADHRLATWAQQHCGSTPGQNARQAPGQPG